MEQGKALQGKAIVITGSGRGIGAATAKYIASIGARVVVNDIDAEPARETAAAITGSGGEAVAHVGDIADWDVAGALIALCCERFGTIDGLVNNAGLFELGRIDELDRNSARRIVDTNIIGTVNCAAHAVKPMLAQGSGSIVNISSGAHMGLPAMGMYGATKGAVASLTYSWALDLAGTGIRVNAISPMAETRMVDVSDKYRARHGIPPNPPVHAPPEYNSPAIAYLLSDESSRLNGQMVRIEADQLAVVAHPAVILPTLQRDGGWDLEAIRKAFAETLDGNVAPVGITAVEIARYAPPSGFWEQEGAQAGNSAE